VKSAGHFHFRRSTARHHRAGETAGARIDLEFNYPVLPTQAALYRKASRVSIARKISKPRCGRRQHGTQAGETFRQIPYPQNWSPDPSRSSSPQWSAMHRRGAGRWCRPVALRRRGADLSFVKGIAARRGVTLGAACQWITTAFGPTRAEGASRGKSVGLYIQPTIQNRWA